MVPFAVEPQLNCTRCGHPLAADRPYCDQCGAAVVAYPPPALEDEPQEFMPVRTGDVLEGKWRLERRLGTGGMGTVYLAHELHLDRKVAIKVLGTSFAGDAEVVARFEREARITASLEHPNIVHVYSVGRLENRPFIVMKYLPGRTLAAFIRERGKLERDELMPILRQICAGLDFIHSRFFIHRDIKAGNIFVSPEGHVTILDFGILRSAKNPDALTRTGILVGTPQYMSPEQARGEKEIDHRSDIYALAILIYECLTGSLPFDANSELSIIQMQAFSPPPDLHERAPWVPPAVAAVVMRALEKRPEDRFNSAGEMLIALEQAYETGQVPATLPFGDLAPAVSASGSTSAHPPTPRPGPPPAPLSTLPSLRKRPPSEEPSAPVPSTPPPAPSHPTPKPQRAFPWIWLVSLPVLAGVGYFAVQSLGSGSKEKAATVLLDSKEKEPMLIPTTQIAGLKDGGERLGVGEMDAGAEQPEFGLRLDLEGSDAGTIAAAERSTLEVPLKRTRPPKKVASLESGQLNIVTLYKGDTHWAGVSVDGVPRGTTPVLLELPVGKHKVRVERTGFKPVEREIKIARGRPRVLRIDLAP